MYKVYLDPSQRQFPRCLQELAVEIESCELTSERLFSISNDLSRCLQLDFHRSERQVGKSENNLPSQARRENDDPLFASKRADLIAFIVKFSSNMIDRVVHMRLGYLLYIHIVAQAELLAVIKQLMQSNSCNKVLVVTSIDECCKSATYMLESISKDVSLVAESRSCMLQLMELISVLISICSEGLVSVSEEGNLLSAVVKLLTGLMDTSFDGNFFAKEDDQVQYDVTDRVTKTYIVDDRVDVVACAIVVGTLLKLWNCCLRRLHLYLSVSWVSIQQSVGLQTQGDVDKLCDLSVQCSHYANNAIRALGLRRLMHLLSSNDSELLSALLQLAEIDLHIADITTTKTDETTTIGTSSQDDDDDDDDDDDSEERGTKRLKAGHACNQPTASMLSISMISVPAAMLSSPLSLPATGSLTGINDGSKKSPAQSLALTAFVVFVADIMCFDANVFCDLLNSPETCALQYFLRVTKAMMKTIVLPDDNDEGDGGSAAGTMTEYSRYIAAGDDGEGDDSSYDAEDDAVKPETMAVGTQKSVVGHQNEERRRRRRNDNKRKRSRQTSSSSLSLSCSSSFSSPASAPALLPLEEICKSICADISKQRVKSGTEDISSTSNSNITSTFRSTELPRSSRMESNNTDSDTGIKKGCDDVNISNSYDMSSQRGAITMVAAAAVPSADCAMVSVPPVLMPPNKHRRPAKSKCIVRLEEEVSYTVSDSLFLSEVLLTTPRIQCPNNGASADTSTDTVHVTESSGSTPSRMATATAAPTPAIMLDEERSHNDGSSSNYATNSSYIVIDDDDGDGPIYTLWLDWLIDDSYNTNQPTTSATAGTAVEGAATTAGSILKDRFISFLVDLYELLGKLQSELVFDSTLLRNRLHALLQYLN